MAPINVCYGCLSADRRLFQIEEHAKLYRQLLLKRANEITQNRKMCWECLQVLKNIQTFRMKITQAQKLLSKTLLAQPRSLSNLSVSKNVDDYQLILYEDEKLNIAPTQLELSRHIKEEIQDISDAGIEFHESDDTKLFIKDEPKDEFFDIGDDNKDEITEFEELLIPVHLPEKRTEKVKENKTEGKKKCRELKQKYRTVIFDDITDKRNYYEVVTIDQETALKWLEKKKEKSAGKPWQCQRCFCGFKQKKHYDRHLALSHAQKNKFECALCGVRVESKRNMKGHVSQHYVQFSCKLCREIFPSRNSLYIHFVHGPHGRQMECRECGARFDCNKPRDFYNHYQITHGLPQCDYCGMRCTKKSRLAHHIKIRHSSIRCNVCNTSFSSYHALTMHNRRKHTTDATERNYCVECDLQFDNTLRYKEHVTRSSKHRTIPRIPCPACDRTYSKRCYMMNHYNLEHLHQSKWVCPHCDRSFLNGFRLRCHVKYTHEKAPKPKHNICSFCGRGFNTRRILDNHVRTHTGERPFACAHCSAAFAQQTALKTHMRSAHK